MPPRKKSRPRRTSPTQDSEGGIGASSLFEPTVELIPARFPGGAATIVYIHGIGPKPKPEVLKCQWDHALFGGDLGDRSRMAFWMNELYHEYLDSDCNDSSWVSGAGVDQPYASAGALPEDDEAPPFAEGSEGAMERLASEIGDATEAFLGDESSSAVWDGYGSKVIPAPLPVRQWIARRVTRAFLRDVNDFLYRPDRCAEMCERLRERLVDGGGPYVVIGHSQGSMIAYHVLRQLPKSFPVPLFLTIGSPLGLQEVRDRLPKLDGGRSLMTPPCVGQWVNVADRLDPVAARQRIASFYRASAGRSPVEDYSLPNPDRASNPHSGSGYLSLPQIRQLVSATMAWEGPGLISPSYLTRDLSAELERGRPEQRHPVLIELLSEEAGEAGYPGQAATRKRVVDWIETHAAVALPELPADADVGVRRQAVAEAAEIEELHSYVAARLTRSELERMVAALALRRDAVPGLGGATGNAALWRVFLNLEKSALVWESALQVHVPTARRAYDADGRGIEWAVLDSGIDPRHPHFLTHRTVVANWDCVPRGEPTSKPLSESTDATGHGTHVAGILAGTMPGLDVEGVAPLARLHVYRVLDDKGRGRDATIIKALDHIYSVNRDAAELRIHGVNLSLGGPFDPRSFGCGDTPLCKQLHRLWRQGVVVVVAAGNEGYREVALASYAAAGLTLGNSIADPANLEDAISVGSVHRSRPHFYGVSYFSSRGPTADGRAKPDLVAPGERIRSCRSFHGEEVPDVDANDPSRDRYYREDSGTSMAAPHVSGLVAAFLSARREFIGHPDRVKRLLLEHCTDLGRERSHQGAGVPNLVKMLLNT
jgi:subtilisin family serine protease